MEINLNFIMKTRYIYSLLFLICLLFGLSSCSTVSLVEHWIDNPTDKEIVVNIDGTNITIPAKSGINYKFEYGKHTLTYNGGSVNFIVKPSKTSGFINPTQSNYILYKKAYVNENDPRATESYMAWSKKQISSQTQIITNGSLQTLSLPFKVVNDPFIEKANYNWDYYLDETIPTNISLQNAVVTKRNRSLASDQNYQAGKFQSVKSKIFREAEFLDYLKKSGVEDDIAFPQNTVKLNELPKIEMEKIDLDGIACPPGREAIELALEHWNNWFTLKGSDFVKEYSYIDGLSRNVLTRELVGQCYDDYNKDFTYKSAYIVVTGVISKIHYLNFFIIE